MNKKGNVILIFVIILVLGLLIFGKPISIWIFEQVTNKTFVSKINSTDFSLKRIFAQEKEIIEKFDNLTK